MDSILYNYSDNTDINNIVTLLIEDIESFFEKEKERKKETETEYSRMYQLSKYIHFEIDRIQMDIHIQKENKNYYFILSAKNFWYIIESINDNNTIYLFQSCYFHTVSELLEHIKYVQNNYHFFDNILCSSKQKEKIIKLKKTLSFFPQEDNECSICYEPTKQVTVCNHPICLHCRESCILLQNDNCPICRGSKLYHYPYNPLFIL